MAVGMLRTPVFFTWLLGENAVELAHPCRNESPIPRQIGGYFEPSFTKAQIQRVLQDTATLILPTRLPWELHAELNRSRAVRINRMQERIPEQAIHVRVDSSRGIVGAAVATCDVACRIAAFRIVNAELGVVKNVESLRQL